MINLRSLQCAQALAEHRHFGRAADSLGISQSGLTQNIQRLEASLGVPLFTRQRSAPVPTVFGEVVLDHGARMLEMAKAMEREVDLLNELKTGQLLIGVDPMFASSLLAPALTELMIRHPQLRYRIRTGGWAELAPELVAGNLDLFFGYEGTQTMSDLERTDLLLDAPIVLGRSDHPLLQVMRPLAENFFEYPLIQGPLPRWYLDWVTNEFEQRELSLDIPENYFLQANDAGVLINIAKNSLAIFAAMPADVQDAMDSRELLEIRPANWPARVPAVIAWRAGRPLAPAAERLMAELKSLPAVLNSDSAKS